MIQFHIDEVISMKKNKIQINDKVRSVYNNYYTALKDDYHLPCNWESQKDNPSKIVLGGEYIIIEIAGMMLLRIRIEDLSLSLHF